MSSRHSRCPPRGDARQRRRAARRESSRPTSALASPHLPNTSYLSNINGCNARKVASSAKPSPSFVSPPATSCSERFVIPHKVSRQTLTVSCNKPCRPRHVLLKPGQPSPEAVADQVELFYSDRRKCSKSCIVAASSWSKRSITAFASEPALLWARIAARRSCVRPSWRKNKR